MSTFTLPTEHGQIHITDTGPKPNTPTLLLLHGNSSSSKIFSHILSSPSLSQYRLIAFDLPGHGSSSNAPVPEDSYTMPAYASLALHILTHLNIHSVAVFGWSLGGHIALEMLDQNSARSGLHINGAVLTGTPPACGAAQCARGFKIPVLEAEENLMARESWSPEQAERIARGSAPAGRLELFEAWMLDDALRTDGRARRVMFDAFLGGRGADQVGVVKGREVLVAVINGGEEPFVDLEYLDGLEWGRLWRGECVRMGGLGHAPFWEDPEGFEELLLEFLGDCAEG